MNWFLRAKHWQIFVLIFVLPFVLDMLGIFAIALTHNPFLLFACFFLVMILVLVVQFGWFYTVGKALGELTGPNSGMNTRRFRNFVLVPCFYFGVLFIGMGIFALFMMNGGRPSPFLALSFFIIIPMYFFSLFCIFYSIWFIAKSLKMAERWNHVELGDYIGDFFLTWFLFIGIWFLQPRINRLFDPTLPPRQAPAGYYNPPYTSQQYYPPQQPVQPPLGFYHPPQDPPPAT